MSWAMRRRILYILGLCLFFGVVFGLPIAYTLLTVPPTCVDGQQNQGETAPDMGGPCPKANVNQLSPSNVLWARAFKIRNGAFSVAAYIENPNEGAGIASIPYIFSLYDEQNVLVAERRGTTYVMPGGITPVYEGDIDTGNRTAVHAFFRFVTKGQWLHFSDMSSSTVVSDRALTNITSEPRLEATITNTDVTPRTDIQVVATIFDTAGNAFASSATHLDKIDAGQSAQVVFTWPDPFLLQVGRIDIIPSIAPKPAWNAPCKVVGEELECVYR